MGTPADELQRVFKTLGDPTRVRILRLLASEELVVQELMEVLGMAQSRVSRHLAILREAGLLSDRRDGTYVFYRFDAPADGPWRDAWTLVARNLEDDPTAQRDDAALERVIEGRSQRSQSFFDAVGPEWDALRVVFDDDLLRARAVGRLVAPGLRVADIGTGTGILAIELAALGLDVVGIDNAPRMLDAVRAKLARRAETAPPLPGAIELHQAEATALPLEDGELDAAFAHMMLHSLAAPGDAIREMARVVRPGGLVVVADFVSHEQEWMRQELGMLWLGFDPDEVVGWLREAGLEPREPAIFEPASRGRDLPSTFIAAGLRPPARA